MSTANLYKVLLARILGFVPIGGGTVSASLGTRLYLNNVPDSGSFPFGIMRLINGRNNTDGNTDRTEMDLEILLFAKPRSQAYVLETVADKIDAAMLRWSDNTSGSFSFSRSRDRDTIAGYAEMADREVVTIRQVFHLTSWAEHLTAYSGSL